MPKSDANAVKDDDDVSPRKGLPGLFRFNNMVFGIGDCSDVGGFLDESEEEDSETTLERDEYDDGW